MTFARSFAAVRSALSKMATILIQFTNNKKEKLALIEKSESFLTKTCQEVRIIISKEIGELLPSNYRFLHWGNPMSRNQESTSTLMKCASSHTSGLTDYPEGLTVYTVCIQQIQETAMDNTLSVAVGSVTKDNQIKPDQKGMQTQGMQTLLGNLEAEKTALTYRFNVAEATLSSLKETPRSRMPIGANLGFTCSKCHYKGHRSSSCRQPPCEGFFECGNTALHKEHKEELKKAESEVRHVKKMLDNKADEIKNTNFMIERSKTNFFSCVRRRLHESNPIKYSNRVELDNDLRILAAACSHKVPGEDVDLEEIIFNYKKRSNSFYRGKEQTPMASQTNMIHQLCTTKTIVSSPNMQYQMLSSYQYLSSPGQTSNNNASSSPTKKRKRLTYVPVCKSPVQSDKGAVFRANLNKQYNVRDDDDDDETQDIISDKGSPQFTPIDSSTPEYRESSSGHPHPPDDDPFQDESESQGFNYNNWVAKQQSISKSIR